MLRINQLPIVRIVRYVEPHEIVDDALVTEELHFRLIADEAAEPPPPPGTRARIAQSLLLV